MDHSNRIRHIHHLRQRDPQGGTKTVVEVVFVTQDPSSNGDAAGFVTKNSKGQTLTKVVTVSPTNAPKTSPTPASKKPSILAENAQETSRSTLKTSARSPSASSTLVRSSTITHAASQTSAFGSSTTLDSASTLASPSSTEPPRNSAGLTIGAYAGVVGGGVVFILLLIVAVAVFLKRRKNSNYEKPEDEKKLNRMSSFNDRSLDSPVSIPEPKPVALAPAPKLDLRPITQFDDSFLPSSDALRSEDKPTKAPPPALSMGNNKLAAGPFETPEPSPAMSAFSDTSNMSLPIQGTPTGPGPSDSSPVHRVMVDFKPSMADELELHANEVVRLLHEYDDGWALCIRMDRSQQGVCPRTCLSPRPVKPRPPPGSRPGPPPLQTGPSRGPVSPSPFSPVGRPQSPGFSSGSRPQSPRSPGFNRPPMSPKGMPGPPRRPMGPDSRPQSPMNARPPHPLSKVQRDDEIQFHAM
ncbi:hypothetical protein Dda_8786 [Drechslerella dactyloides]|uniref:SH3 domain-containing protein n=1 Tax=Drechslerella dactyloides TaxID=74499 RepID=A0AAD6IQ03_DREDA|nr:hypothetical protein Dda_8786 [Drechslerella dactyloides]